MDQRQEERIRTQEHPAGKEKVKTMMNLKHLETEDSRTINGGGAYCRVCGYGNRSYKSKLDVARHILRNHFGIFTAVYAANIWKYRKLLARTLAL